MIIPPPVTQSLPFNNSFETSLDGWQEFSAIRIIGGSITPFDNYDLSIDSTTGMPAPSAHISGDGHSSKSGMHQTIDISSIDSNSPLYLSFDYRTTSNFAVSSVTNTHLGIHDGVTGIQLHSESLIAGGTLDSGWQSYNTDISSITSGHDSITIRLYLMIHGLQITNQQNWYDNVILGTEQQPIGQSSPIPSKPITPNFDNDDVTLSVIITTQTSTVSNESFTFSGTSNNADQVALYREGTYTNNWVAPDEYGDWSFDVTLSEGENVLGVVVANDHDFTSTDDIIVTLDTTIPPAPPAINQPSQITTNDDSLTLTGTAQAGSIVILNHNNIQLEQVTVDTDGTWSFTVTLSEGTNVFIAFATDESGNQSTPSVPVIIILDTVLPR